MSMNRPYYENADDRRNEKEIASKLEAAWGCTLTKLPLDYRVDYVATRGGIKALIEIKRRRVSINTYPTIMLSMHKVFYARQFAEMCGAQPIFVVQYDDALVSINLNEKPDSIDTGGRKDRGDDQDIEIVYHYSIDRLKLIM